MINPLLKELSNNFKIPPFDIIKNSHFKEAVIFSISKQNSAIEKICSIRNKPTFKNTIIPFLNSGNKLTEILSIFYSLCATSLTKERENIRKDLLPKISDHFSNIYQNKKAKNVPGTLREAIDLAKKSKLLPQIFQSDVLEHYIHAAEWEQSEYDKSVNDWEHRRYFERE